MIVVVVLTYFEFLDWVYMESICVCYEILNYVRSFEIWLYDFETIPAVKKTTIIKFSQCNYQLEYVSNERFTSNLKTKLCKASMTSY